MNEPLSPQLERKIREKVDSGEYPDAGSVVGTALLALEDQERAMKSLRADIDVGLQQIREGRVTVDSDEMWRGIESRANQRFNDSEQESPNV